MRPPPAQPVKFERALPTIWAVLRRLAIRLLRDQRGFTLIEQLVVAMGLIFVISAIAGMTEVAERTVPRDNARGFAVRESQVGHDGMTRELRHAYAVAILPGPDTGDRLQASVQLRGRQYTVEYDCTGAMPGASGQRRCMRSEGGGTAAPVIQRLVGTGPVFTRRLRDGQPYYVATDIQVSAADGRRDALKHTVVMRDGFYLRNVDAAR